MMQGNRLGENDWLFRASLGLTLARYGEMIGYWRLMAFAGGYLLA